VRGAVTEFDVHGIGAFTFATGRIRWGYQGAATLTACRVERVEDGWRLYGTVADAHPYRLAQRPLTFEATHTRGVWSWPILDLTVAAGTCTASLSSRKG